MKTTLSILTCMFWLVVAFPIALLVAAGAGLFLGWLASAFLCGWHLGIGLLK